MGARSGEPSDPADDRRPGAPDATALRARMVREQLRDRGIRDETVLMAMGVVPRERFLPADARDQAYADGAQAIGRGQTISQPFIVARMTEALRLDAWRRAHPGRVPRVLDVGTGSGYQAAVLAAMGAMVTTIERDPELAARAARTLDALGISVHAVVGDGGEGHPSDGPYAGIVVAAAAPDVPSALVQQLEPGGRLVMPIGPRDRQVLTTIVRDGTGGDRQVLEPCVFVPLLGPSGYTEPRA